ncbi:trehalose operon repressor [Hutsoniella sourekii]|uniref:trehalose operon repressor n=1 Tax=Hutsoniella sourekii TaxID=87650 RepID=UPI0004872B93|nr:trehalose operon repressor [Hutsoniella sourekii]
MHKFERIAQDIQAKIQDRTYPAGQVLPSEHQLADHYQVSRETIRRALRILTDQGAIHKQQGYGSVVLDWGHTNNLPVSGLVSYKEVQAHQGVQTQTQVLVNEVVDAPSFILDQVPSVSPGDKFIHLVRSRSQEGQVVIVDEDYIRQTIVESIPNDRAEDSIYDYFEGDLGLDIAYALKEFKAQTADSYSQAAMKLTATDYVMDVISYVYLTDNRFFQYTTSHHALDHFSFKEFARRRKY